MRAANREGTAEESPAVSWEAAQRNGYLALIRTRVEEVAALAHAPLNICAHHLHLEVVLNIALDAKRRIVLAPQTIFIAELRKWWGGRGAQWLMKQSSTCCI